MCNSLKNRVYATLVVYYLNRILYFYKELQVILLGDLNL